jgi:hypothetical protein
VSQQLVSSLFQKQFGDIDRYPLLTKDWQKYQLFTKICFGFDKFFLFSLFCLTFDFCCC